LRTTGGECTSKVWHSIVGEEVQEQVKAASKYVEEIDPCNQFHQNFTSTIFANVLLPNKYRHKLSAEMR